MGFCLKINIKERTALPLLSNGPGKIKNPGQLHKL